MNLGQEEETLKQVEQPSESSNSANHVYNTPCTYAGENDASLHMQAGVWGGLFCAVSPDITHGCAHVYNLHVSIMLATACALACVVELG